jgi:hypothetical protein
MIIGSHGSGVRQPGPTARATASNPTGAAPITEGGSKVLGRSFIQVLSEGRRPPSAPARIDMDLRADLDDGKARSAVTLRGFAERALRAEVTVDALIEAASRGKTFTASELIALQAVVFRYAQTVEVLSRAADRVIGSIKQALGTQV